MHVQYYIYRKKVMDLIISQNGYSDYKRKTIESHDDHQEDSSDQVCRIPLQSYL